MIRLSTESRLSPAQVLEKAISFFAGSLGLEITQSEPSSMQFEGAGGFVIIDVTEGNRTAVDLAAHEWDYRTRQFAQQIR